MSEQTDGMKELTFTVKVKVLVRSDLSEDDLRVEGAELHLVRGEGAAKSHLYHRVQWTEFTSALESASAGGPPAVPQPSEVTSDYCGPCRAGNHDKCYEPCLCRARKHMPAPASAGGEALPPVTDEELAALLRDAARLTPAVFQHPYRVMAWRLARGLEKARGDLEEVRVYLDAARARLTDKSLDLKAAGVAPAVAAWEAADLEGRMATLNMLLDEAARLEQFYFGLGRSSQSAAAMRCAHAVLQRPETLSSKDMSVEDHEAAVAACLAATGRPASGAAAEVQGKVRKFLEELITDYQHDAVDHRGSRDTCRRCRAIRLLGALDELQQGR